MPVAQEGRRLKTRVNDGHIGEQNQLRYLQQTLDKGEQRTITRHLVGEAVGFDIDQNMKMHGIVCNVFTGATKQVDDPNGIGTTTFNGLNDLGQIVGFYLNGAGNTIGLLATPKR
jgi:hypothetical protein